MMMARKEEKISGFVEKIILSTTNNLFKFLVRDKNNNLIRVLGYPHAPIIEGKFVSFLGYNQFHPIWGRHFKIKNSPKLSLDKKLKEYCKRILEGIGPVLSNRLINSFGIEILEVIDKSPNELKRVKGIGPAKVKTIKEIWRKQKAVAIQNGIYTKK